MKKRKDYSSYYRIIDPQTYECLICGKKYSKMGINTHIWRSHFEGQSHKPAPIKPWNKGLTKDTSISIKRAAEAYSQKCKNGLIIPPQTGKAHSKEFKQKLSETIKEKVKNGEWHYSFSKVRSHEYTSPFAGDVKLHGSWELAYAKYLDANNIQWIRPTQKEHKFKYTFSELKGGEGFYIPDFYLVNENVWVEIKGYETEKDRAKWASFPHSLRILKEKDLKELNLI